MTNSDHRKALVERILEGPGRATNEQRKAAFGEADSLPLIAKVRTSAWKISDEDVTAAKQQRGEDEIFELAVCAAVGQATRQLDSALAALAAATKKE